MNNPGQASKRRSSTPANQLPVMKSSAKGGSSRQRVASVSYSASVVAINTLADDRIGTGSSLAVSVRKLFPVAAAPA